MATSRELPLDPRQGQRKLSALGSRLDTAMVVVNLIGVLVYLRSASLAWRIPEERAAGINTVTGEPFIWAGLVFPIWALFLLVNAAWLAITLRRRERLSATAWVLVAIGWIAGIAIDFAHH